MCVCVGGGGLESVFKNTVMCTYANFLKFVHVPYTQNHVDSNELVYGFLINVYTIHSIPILLL